MAQWRKYWLCKREDQSSDAHEREPVSKHKGKRDQGKTPSINRCPPHECTDTYHICANAHRTHTYAYRERERKRERHLS